MDEQAREIEPEADPVRRRVTEMFERYPPQTLGNRKKVREVEALLVFEQPVPRAADPAIVRHRPGDDCFGPAAGVQSTSCTDQF